jgi:hypothetical protein
MRYTVGSVFTDPDMSWPDKSRARTGREVPSAWWPGDLPEILDHHTVAT